MKRWKRVIAGILMLGAMITFIPAGAVQAAPAKLNAKDFSYTVNGEKVNFLKDTQNGPAYSKIIYEFTSKKDIKDSVKSFETSRGVQLGDKASYVKKKYGNTSKVKVSKKEKFYKEVMYNSQYGMVDFSLWKSYLEYNYKKGSDKYKLRFYLDRRDRVSAAVYLKNLDKFYNFPNKQVKSGLIFHAPKGKKVTTKTINGKKVYLLPKGTKISFRKGAISKSKFKNLDVNMCRYSEYSECIEGQDGLELLGSKYKYKQGKKYSLESLIKKYSWECFSDSYEKFLCCRMSFYQYAPETGYSTTVAPEQFYFILEGDGWYYK